MTLSMPKKVRYVAGPSRLWESENAAYEHQDGQIRIAFIVTRSPEMTKSALRMTPRNAGQSTGECQLYN